MKSFSYWLDSSNMAIIFRHKIMFVFSTFISVESGKICNILAFPVFKYKLFDVLY